MKKIILLAILAVVSFTAKAQDTKPYEEKMAKLESAFKELEDAYHSFSKRDPATFTDAEKTHCNSIGDCRKVQGNKVPCKVSCRCYVQLGI